MIDAAVACLVADVDSPTLRVLAGESPAGSRFDLEPVIEQTLDELGLHVLPAQTPGRERWRSWHAGSRRAS